MVFFFKVERYNCIHFEVIFTLHHFYTGVEELGVLGASALSHLSSVGRVMGIRRQAIVF